MCTPQWRHAALSKRSSCCMLLRTLTCAVGGCRVRRCAGAVRALGAGGAASALLCTQCAAVCSSTRTIVLQSADNRPQSCRLWPMMPVDATNESSACCDRRRRCALRDLCVACSIMPQTLGEQTDKPWFVQAAASLYRFAVSCHLHRCGLNRCYLVHML